MSQKWNRLLFAPWLWNLPAWYSRNRDKVTCKIGDHTFLKL
ncbi:MAG: hypothetical protein PHW74_07250 [Desulfobacca sp.]|nr:hypothetical protein [Desulfobacca sp.]